MLMVKANLWPIYPIQGFWAKLSESYKTTSLYQMSSILPCSGELGDSFWTMTLLLVSKITHNIKLFVSQDATNSMTLNAQETPHYYTQDRNMIQPNKLEQISIN